jgi:hypothetical protein
MDERIVRWRYRLDIVHSSFCLLVFLGQGDLFEDGIFLTTLVDACMARNGYIQAQQ